LTRHAPEFAKSLAIPKYFAGVCVCGGGGGLREFALPRVHTQFAEEQCVGGMVRMCVFVRDSVLGWACCCSLFAVCLLFVCCLFGVCCLLLLWLFAAAVCGDCGCVAVWLWLWL
jgi:hypothetical protein